MAYYTCSYYDSNFGEYYQTPCYDDSHEEVFSSEASAANSSYSYNDYNYNCVDPCYSAYDPASCYGPYDSDISYSTSAYSSYTCGEPKYVEYGIDPYGGDYSTVKTRFIISFSVSDDQFNMPMFEEYDPTPYGGGYDLDATYGKPLPPSEGICYPPSSADPTDIFLSNFSYGSIPSPYGKDTVEEPIAKPSNGSKAPTATAKDQELPVRNVNSNGKPADSPLGEERKENYPDVNSARTEQGNGGTEYEKRVSQSQIPPGYGLEAMDLCESLFGYWPCLARAKRENDYRNCQGVYSKANNDNCLWEVTADYLFGNSYPYGERWSNGGIYENPIFNYERHYQEEHLSRQVEYHEEYSWLN